MYRIYANKTVEKRKFTTVGLDSRQFGNEALDWMYCCNIWKLPHAAFGEKSFVTVVIPGNGHRTAMPVLHFERL